MPSAFHEGMAGKFSDEIVEWLVLIRIGTLCLVDSTKEGTKRIAKKISSSLAKRVKYRKPHDDRMEPDLSFTYEDCGIADLVVEVAWSQRNLKLPYRAARYIEGKNGGIHRVLAFRRLLCQREPLDTPLSASQAFAISFSQLRLTLFHST